jgi:predicted esterase
MQTIKINKTVRFATHGNPKRAKKVWFVLHGYGQLPAYFIRKFQHLDPDENFVVAPEGMHRFYLNGTSGRVGASWMTKEARTDDIADNINYLNKLWSELCQLGNFQEKILLGFSQGGATAARWHELGNFSARTFILWASVFPPDLDFRANKSAFAQSKNYFVLGNEDPYYANEQKDQVLETMEDLQFETLFFEGKHELNTTILKQIESAKR